MKHAVLAMRALCGTLAVLAILAGCASYGGRGLKPGESTLADVLDVMGTPAMQWENSDRSVQLSYPRGPVGVHSFMVYINSEGRLVSIENVMQSVAFGRVQAGMTQAEVLQTLGPPVPAWTTYFAARRELVWEWRYCDDWNAASRFDVLFDGDTGKVRSTLTWREDCHRGPCRCGR